MPGEALIYELCNAIGARDINVRPLGLALKAIHRRWLFKEQSSFLLLAETVERAKSLFGMFCDIHNALPWHAQPMYTQTEWSRKNLETNSLIEADWIREPGKGNRYTAILLDVNAETAKRHNLLGGTVNATHCRIISDAESPNWGFDEWDILQIDGTKD